MEFDAKNREPLEFLTAVEEYESKRTGRVRHEIAGNIISTFIKPFCKKEINIGDKERKQLINGFTNEYAEDNCPSNLFACIYTIVLTELKLHCFPKFLKSGMFKDFIMEKMQNSNDSGQEFLRFISIKKDTDGRRKTISN